MERELWPPLYRLLSEVAATVRQKGVCYQPGLIVAVLLRAALHDRPIAWACRRRNWDTPLRPRRLPSPATMSRRLRGLAVAAVLRGLEDRLRQADAPDLVQVIDGKSLPVGGNSKGRDARLGHGAGTIAKGYKLYAIWAGRPMPEAWSINSLDVNEAREAPALMAGVHRAGYLVGDNQYDSSALYDAAAAQGLRLRAARKDAAAGISPGHYQAPDRLRAADELRPPELPARGRGFVRAVMAVRRTIEGRFGNATSFGGGLGPLPARVRRRHRVVRWVWAKRIIHGIRTVKKHRLTA
jgi:hypothetical protein